MNGGAVTPVFLRPTSRQTGVVTHTKHAEGGDYDGEEDRKESDEEGREEALALLSREREGAAVAPFVFFMARAVAPLARHDPPKPPAKAASYLTVNSMPSHVRTRRMRSHCCSRSTHSMPATTWPNTV